MRASYLLAAAACAAVASAQVRLPFARREDSIAAAAAAGTESPAAPGRDRRSVPALDIWANGWNYLVNVSVGTPPQQMSMRLAVQVGPSWVPDAKYCGKSSHRGGADDAHRDEYAACRYGAFDAARSSSFVNPGTEALSTEFADEYVTGEWVSDVLDLAGARVPKLVMGFVDSAPTRVGVLGLGFNQTHHPSAVTRSSSATLTVPERLVRDGVIASPAYSLWVDDKSAKSGHLLLGAVDKSKFEGPLVRIRTNTFLPGSSAFTSRSFDTVIYSANGSRSATDELRPLGVASESPFANGGDDDDDLGIKYHTVLVAPEYTVSVLPFVIARDIWSLAGASWDQDLGQTVIPCDAAETSTGHVAMQLDGADGPVLNVSIADLVVPKSTWNHSRWAYALGGAALKRAYMVLDPANAEMAFARARLGSTAAEDVVPFASYGASIPESTLAKHVPSFCSSYSTSNGFSSECTGDGSGSGGSGGGDYGSGGGGGGGIPASVYRSMKLGIGLGVGLFCFVVLCLTIWATRRCRRIRKEEKDLSEKQADVGRGADAQVVAGAGEVAAQDGSLPQKPPSAVARERPPQDRRRRGTA
ncbi:acid protease [Colletotrichum falcatum]|nr:acid protease [Colletotrichum falcatum]